MCCAKLNPHNEATYAECSPALAAGQAAKPAIANGGRRKNAGNRFCCRKLDSQAYRRYREFSLPLRVSGGRRLPSQLASPGERKTFPQKQARFPLWQGDRGFWTEDRLPPSPAFPVRAPPSGL